MDVDSSVVEATKPLPMSPPWDDADSCCSANDNNSTTNYSSAATDTDTPLSSSSISISVSTGNTDLTTSREEEEEEEYEVVSGYPLSPASDDGECHRDDLIDEIGGEHETLKERDDDQYHQQHHRQQHEELTLPSIGELPPSLEIIESYNLYGNEEKFLFMLQSYRQHKKAIELLISQKNKNGSCNCDGSSGSGGGGSRGIGSRSSRRSSSSRENQSLLKYIGIELNYLEEFYRSFPFQAKNSNNYKNRKDKSDQNSNNNNNNNNNKNIDSGVIVNDSTKTTQAKQSLTASMDLSHLTSTTACVSTTTPDFINSTTSVTTSTVTTTTTTTTTTISSVPKPDAALPADPTPQSTTGSPPVGATTLEMGVSVADLDRSDKDDPQCVVDYVGDIFHYFVEKEVSQKLNPCFLSIQTEINEKMRAILIDWMVDVQYSLKLLPETLYLSINILDHFLARTIIRRSQLQLVGISCMVIACKYEEIFPPECNDFIYISDNATTHDQIISMERSILSSLQFSVTFVSPLDFLRRYSRLANSNYAVHSLSKYLMETMLLDANMAHYQPSMIAAGAVYLARAMVGVAPHWTPGLEQMTGYTPVSVRRCALNINSFVKLVATSTLRTIKKKYATSKYGKVANIELLTFND